MNKEAPFSLTRQALIAAMISAAFPITTMAAAGKVDFTIGNVTALGADGRERALAKGGEIISGDTIQTANGRAQLRFSDGGYISLQPNTDFKVDDYNYEGKSDGSEKGFFNLIKGGLRFVTGSIGHANKNAYRINTPVATIGIRGSGALAEMDGDKLKVKVMHGAIYVVNENGDLILFEGQSGEVDGKGGKPGYSDEDPSIKAAGPDGAKPGDVQEEQQQEQQDLGTFTVAEQYDSSGLPGPLGSGPAGSGGTSIVGIVQNLNSQNLTGTYVIDANQANSLTNGTDTGVATGGSLVAQFGTYQVTAALNVSVTNSSSATFSGTLGGSGPINSANATFSISGSGTGSICGSGCTLSATGAFSGANAVKAGMNYSISTIFGPLGNLNGTVGFTQTLLQ